MITRLERWLFPVGSAERLAALRIGLAAILGLRMLRTAYVELSAQPPELFRPVSFMHAFGSMPPRAVVIAIQVAGVAAAVAAVAGVRARATFPIAWAAAALLGGMTTSGGKIVHNDVLPLLAAVPLLVAPVSDAWARGARGRRPPSVRYGWPVRTATVVVALTYALTGLHKLFNSGIAWASSDNLRWILYASSDAQRAPNPAALFVADRPWLAHAIAAGTMLVELGFVLVLVRPRVAWLFVPGSAALTLGIWAMMRLNYWPWPAAAIVVFVDWPAVVRTIRREPAPTLSPG